jgi:hypothetical protein
MWPTFTSRNYAERYWSAVVRAFQKFMEDAREVIAVMKKLRAEAGIV